MKTCKRTKLTSTADTQKGKRKGSNLVTAENHRGTNMNKKGRKEQRFSKPGKI
jgi:hypothetical protein